jgi:hypothetical protein
VLRGFHTDIHSNKSIKNQLTTTYHTMENSKKDEFTPILSDIIRMMVMTRLGLAKEENRPILAMIY